MIETTVASSAARRLACDFCGGIAICVATLGTVLALCSLNLLGNGVIVWLVGTAVFVVVSFYLWYGSPRVRGMDSHDLLMGVLFTPLVGAMFFAVDVYAGSTRGHYQSFIHAALHAGSPFGIVLTFSICPVGTILFLGAWARAEMRERLMPTEDKGE